MNLTFEISGACSVQGADCKPNEQTIEAAIEAVLKLELGIFAVIYVSNMKEE